MFAAKHFDKYKIVFADIVEHVKQAGSNCNLGKPHLNPNQIKTKESLAQNIKDKTHKVESIMYGEFRSWKRNNNPLLRAKDIFRRHPQKNILNQIYLFHILWMTYKSHVGSLGKDIRLGKELK